MGTIRVLLAMLTLVALALLPGPSHALAGAAAAAHQHAGHAHHGTAPHRHAGIARDAPHHDDRHCKTCSVACCAPAIAAVETSAMVAVAGLRLRPARPAEDRERADAARARALKPPTRLA